MGPERKPIAYEELPDKPPVDLDLANEEIKDMLFQADDLCLSANELREVSPMPDMFRRRIADIQLELHDHLVEQMRNGFSVFITTTYSLKYGTAYSYNFNNWTSALPDDVAMDNEFASNFPKTMAKLLTGLDNIELIWFEWCCGKGRTTLTHPEIRSQLGILHGN